MSLIIHCCKIWREGNGHASGLQHQYLSCFYRDPRIHKWKNFDPTGSLTCYNVFCTDRYSASDPKNLYLCIIHRRIHRGLGIESSVINRPYRHSSLQDYTGFKIYQGPPSELRPSFVESYIRVFRDSSELTIPTSTKKTFLKTLIHIVIQKFWITSSSSP